MLLKQKMVTVPLAESGVGERSPELAFILDLTNFLDTCRTPEKVLECGLTKLCDYLSVETARAYIWKAESDLLEMAVVMGMDAGGLERVVLGQGFTGRAAQARALLAQRVEDLEELERAKLLKAQGIESVLCLPLIASGVLVGVVNLGAKRVMRLDTPTLDLLVVAGGIVAVATQNARRARSIQEQKEAIEFFAYTAYHDLKGPALAIRGLSGRLTHMVEELGGKDRAKRLEICHQINQAAARVDSLVGELNVYLNAKEAEVHLTEVEVAEVVEEIHGRAADELKERGIVWQPAGELPTVRADRLGLTRIYENLVGNALKYGGEGMTRISLGHRAEEESHLFWVADDGAGLAKEQAEKVFGVFARGESARGTQGTGLGLAIVRAIAQRHGGKAWLESEPDQGCTVYFTIRA